MRLSDVLLLPEKTYTDKNNGVQSKILSVEEPPRFNNGYYNQYITLQGLDNTKATIEHSSQKPDSMLNQSHVGKDSTWRLKWWGKKQNLSGYPLFAIQGEGSMTAQPAPAVPYNQPQNAPQPLQQANPTARTIVQDKPDWDAIAEGKVRHGVVCAFIQAGKFDVDVSIIDYWVRYIIDGTVKAPEPQPQEPYQQGVCPDCQLLRVDCTCPQQGFIR